MGFLLNSAAVAATRRALFEVEKLRGAEQERHAFFSCLLRTGRHGDVDVRMETGRGLPVIIQVYPNHLGVWGQFQRNGLLVGPSAKGGAGKAGGGGAGGEEEEEEEEEESESMDLTAPSPDDGGQGETGLPQKCLDTLGDLMILGAVGKASDKVVRLALSALCQWAGTDASLGRLVAHDINTRVRGHNRFNEWS
jgi:hypothetical protein